MAPPVCSAPTTTDWAIDDNTAILFSTEAPIAGSGPRDDTRCIWSFIPDQFDYVKPEVLFYFHGHNNYVKVGYCNHKEGEVPNWVLPVRRGDAASKASGPKYGLNKLPTTQHAPLVLVPEVGRNNPNNTNKAKYPGIDKVLASPADYAAWHAAYRAFHAAKNAHDEAVKKKDPSPPPAPPPEPVPPELPPAITETAGRMDSDMDQIKKMIDDCCNRLRVLPKRVTATSTYLDVTPQKFVDSSKLRRLYLTGHSGGGVPLTAACKNNLARLTGANDMPTDLWTFDATYGTGVNEYTSFCKDLNDKGKLGNGPLLSRFIGIVIKGTQTDTDPNGMTDVVKNMKSVGLTVKEIEFSGDTDIPMLKSTVMCNPITIVRITKHSVEHDNIPTKFTPILLETAGRKGPDCGGSGPTGFLLKVIDTKDKPLAGAPVTVKRQDTQVLASKRDGNGTVFVQGHDLSQPCDVFVDNFGGLGREGHIDPNDPDDGTLPEYDPGSAPDGDGSCGGDYSPPEVLA